MFCSKRSIMLSFSNYLTEAKKKIDSSETEIEPDTDKINSNTALGVAFETLTALHLHDRTDSSKNKDPEHLKRIEEIRAKHQKALAFLTPEKRAKVLKGSDRAATAYLDSLGKQGIKPTDIHEVHHTSTGIDKVFGSKVNQSQNPHDIVVRTKRPHPSAFGPNNDLHGTSLKLTQGTLSNNGVGEMDKVAASHGMKMNMGDIWNKGYKDTVGDMPKKEVKKIRDREDVAGGYLKTRDKVLKHYQNAFNNPEGATPEEKLANQKKHLAYLMKSNPDMNYDYTNAEKGYSKPVSDLDHVKAVQSARSFSTRVTDSMMHIYDHEGKHILSVEHRATHGPWSSIQVNAKLGSMKATGQPAKAHPAAAVNPPEDKAPPAPVQAPPAQRPDSGGFGQFRGEGPNVGKLPRNHHPYKDNSIGGHQDSGQ